MIEEQLISRGIKDPLVLQAFRNVKRHLFVQPEQAGCAYEDRPLPIGFEQTISQPYVVAKMTELLTLNKNSIVLEVGTGSGYQAAVLAEIAKHVYTIELVKELAEQAQQRLERLNYKNITAKWGDGYFGWPEKAPFDGIIVTSAALSVPPALAQQLKAGGKMVIPIGPHDHTQRLILIRRTLEGVLVDETVMEVRFVPFRHVR